jgi:hypothetical protein
VGCSLSSDKPCRAVAPHLTWGCMSTTCPLEAGSVPDHARHDVRVFLIADVRDYTRFTEARGVA